MQVKGTPVYPASAPVVTHPAWCDPRRCFGTDGDTQHCSELVLLRTQDARLTLAWVRADEFDAEDPGVPELRVDIVYDTSGADTSLYLLPREAYQLAEQLLSLYWRECYQRAPVVGPGRVVAS